MKYCLVKQNKGNSVPKKISVANKAFIDLICEMYGIKNKVDGTVNKFTPSQERYVRKIISEKYIFHNMLCTEIIEKIGNEKFSELLKSVFKENYEFTEKLTSA